MFTIIQEDVSNIFPGLPEDTTSYALADEEGLAIFVLNVADRVEDVGKDQVRQVVGEVHGWEVSVCSNMVRGRRYYYLAVHRDNVTKAKLGKVRLG